MCIEKTDQQIESKTLEKKIYNTHTHTHTYIYIDVCAHIILFLRAKHACKCNVLKLRTLGVVTAERDIRN